ncbi:MAG: PduL/EutD family phosphate acyltransferase, partial [Eubacteriales bacterium]|nr:PduL/EutD family phosphate acyltransferase [Eubacteriales bacterium]
MSESFANRLIIAAPEKAAVKLGGILSSAGIAADAVYHSGEEALRALDGQAALLLTTYQLSDMEGAQLTENIPEGCEAMMIVPGDYAAEEGRALLLRNPLTPDALVQAVSRRLFVELEASGRHAHVTKEQAQMLFGHSLTPARPLSQPGQFLAQERVKVLGPKGEFREVAVLGPERKQGQVELSLSDARVLGLSLPVRLSGDIQGSPGVVLEGSRGRVTLDSGAIAAKRHV